MGQSESSFKRTYNETVAELSTVQLQEITARFNELYTQAGGSKGHVVDREKFAKYFNLPPTVGDRLFDAFDEKQNGKISFEEFVCGLAIVLHGSFHDRCALLFRVFNLAGDEGVSREELATMLTAILQSADTILYTVCESGRAVLGSEDRVEAVRIMVDEAFKHCDITGTGKLLPVEFEYWLKRNPKVLDSLLSFRTQEDECTLGQLIMSPSEQRMGVAQQERSGSELTGGGVTEGCGSDTGFDSTDQQEREVIFRVQSDPALQDHTHTDDIITESTHTDDIITESTRTDDIITESTRTDDIISESTSLDDIITDCARSDDIILDHTHSDDISIDAASTEDTISIQHSDFSLSSSVPGGQAPPTNISMVTKPPALVSEPYPGEDDRLAAMWVSSPRTEALLSQDSLTQDQLTCPALMADLKMSDPIGELLKANFPEAKRRALLTVDNVTMDVEGLRKLVGAGCFQSALDLTSRFLSAHGQGAGQSGQPTLHTHKTLQMWSSRLSLLVYLGMYKEAESELEEFGELDNPDLYYEHHTHSYPGRKALVNVFQSRWQAVRDCLHTAMTSDPCNLVIKSNLTVSTFYQGRLKEAIESMEQLVSCDPPASLQPALFANLAAAYELESGQSLGKKLNFVPLLGAHVCEGSQLQCLNIR